MGYLDCVTKSHNPGSQRDLRIVLRTIPTKIFDLRLTPESSSGDSMGYLDCVTLSYNPEYDFVIFQTFNFI